MACLAHELLEEDGLNIPREVRAESIKPEEDQIVVEASFGDKQETYKADELLMATGRKPVVEGLELENADVEYDDTGIDVNPKMQTSQSHIFAVGDVTGK